MALRLVGSTADAEDVTQDVFLGLPEALKTHAARGSLEDWIKRVVQAVSKSETVSVSRLMDTSW